MTYCLAWKARDAIMMIADNMVTANTPWVQMRSHSNFGEQQVAGPKKWIQECALKLIALPNCALAFAGTVHLAYSIAASLKEYLKGGLDAAQAFDRAVKNSQPFNPGD